MATTVDYILKIAGGQAKQSLKGVTQETKTLSTTFAKTSKKIGKNMLAIGASIAAAGTAVLVFGQKMADLANTLSDTATKTGLATSTIAGLKLAAEGSGLSLGSLQSGLIRFQSSMKEAADGTGAAGAAFKTLGVDVKDKVTGEFKSADETFRLITNRLAGMEDQTLRNALAIDVFGQRAGPALIQSGAIGNMKAFSEFAEEFGVNMEDAAEEAALFQRGMAEMKMVTEGVFSSLLTAATGTTKLSDGIFKIADNIVYFGSISKDIFTNLRAFIVGLIEGYKGLSSAIANMGRMLWAAMTGDFDRVKMIFAGTTDFVLQQMKKMKSSMTDGLVASDAMGRSATAAVTKQQELRNSLLASMSGGGGGGGGGGAGDGAADETKRAFVKAFSVAGISEDLAEVSSELADQTNELMGALNNLPSELSSMMTLLKLGLTESAIESLSSPRGMVSGIAALFGPIGSAIGGIVNALGALGTKTPEEIQQEAEAFSMAVANGLAMLPRILIQVLPKFVLQLIKGIGLEILKLPFIIADAIFESLKKIFQPIIDFFSSSKEERQENRQSRRDARKRRREKDGNFVQQLFNTDSGFLSGGIMSAASGARFTGGSRGLAMLHEGETVLPASGRAGQQEQRMLSQSGGGGGINIVINSAVVEHRAIDELVRQLESRFGTFGVGKTPLFGR